MERIPGGKARGGRCPRNVDKTELARGIKVELEHTADRRIAREIACDHLTEDKRYYSKLAAIHLDGPRGRRATATSTLPTLPEAEHAEWVAQAAVTTALKSRDATAIKRAKDAHAAAVEATERAWHRLPPATRAQMREAGEGPPGLDVETRAERAGAFKVRRPGLRGPNDTFTVYKRNETTGHASYVGTFTSQVDAQAYVDQQAAQSRKFVTFEVWTGTPRAPRKPVGPQVRGLHGSRRAPDRLRDQARPEAVGYELDRDTLTPIRTTIRTDVPGDYGADPIGDGMFRMVPSGDIVDYAERMRRLPRKR